MRRQLSSAVGVGDGDGVMVDFVAATADSTVDMVDSMVAEASMAVLAAGTGADIGKTQSC